ncbi:MAG: ABC transporter permease [Atribacterota bacterium]
MHVSGRKGARYLIAIFFIFTMNFFIPRAMPGDPVSNLLGEDFVSGKETLEQIRTELGLNRPLIFQYVEYWKGILSFNFGYSYHFRTRVSALLIARLKWTFLLVAPSLLLGTLVGTLAGAGAGWWNDSFRAYLVLFCFLFLYCAPPFFVSLLFLYLFSFRWGIFPLKGFYSTGQVGDILRHLFLPILVMTIFSASRNFFVMRGSVLQEKGKWYVLYARAKGLSGNQVLFRQVLKNASLPIITLFALDFGFIFSGALFVEIIFSLNGMGTLIYEAVLARDYPVLQGSFLLITLMMVLANYGSDLCYRFLDPRVRQEP